MEETWESYDEVSIYDSRRVRIKLRSQMDFVNSIMEKANSSRSLLEKHVGLLRTMLETWSPKCLLSYDLLSESWDSVDRGEDY